MTEAKSKRRWFSFSIRDLLLMTAILALALGWGLDHWRRESRYAKAELDARTQAAEASRLNSVLWSLHDSDALEKRKILDAAGFDSHLGRGHGYANVKTLAEAVEIIQGQVQQDNKPEYAFLLSEDRIRSAIRTAITSYDAKIVEFEKRFQGVPIRATWAKSKPIFLKIADTGEWPSGGSFMADYSLTDNNATYEGLLLRLNITTSDSQRFGLPIIDLYFGHLGD